MRHLILLLFVLASSLTHAASSMKNPPQLLLFGQITTISPKQVNEHLEAQGVDPFVGILGYGLEGSFPLLSRFDVGFRGSYFYQRENENEDPPTNPADPDKASLRQSRLMAIARINLVETGYVRVDAVGGVGGAVTQLKTRIASDDARYDRGGGDGKNASLVTMYGASLAVGASGVYLTVEGGIEQNDVNRLTRKYNTNNSITAIDMSGPYLLVGLLFNGKPGFLGK